ncbi:hypothetical protein ES703_88166 [subsurface metagenome]
MRRAIIPVILVAVLVTSALLSGCATTEPGKSSGDVITEAKDFTGFTRVAVEGTFDVNITRSDTYSILISADTDFYDYVAVTKEGDTLRIYLNPRHTFTDFTRLAKTLKAEITMPALYELQLSGASDGSVSGFKSSDDFNLGVSGASSCTIDDSVVGDVELEVSGASQVSGKVDAGDIEFDVSGASTIKLEGSANNITLNASGASDIDLEDFPLNNAYVDLSGASKSTVNVKGRLDCMLSAAAKLYFLGNPSMGNVNISGASTIKHK